MLINRSDAYLQVNKIGLSLRLRWCEPMFAVRISSPTRPEIVIVHTREEIPVLLNEVRSVKLSDRF